MSAFISRRQDLDPRTQIGKWNLTKGLNESILDRIQALEEKIKTLENAINELNRRMI